MSYIITVEDLNLWYGSTQALHHVSMEIPCLLYTSRCV